MKQVKIGNTILGDGRIKICLPIVAAAKSEIESQLLKAVKHAPDLLEFRADWYEAVFEKAKLKSVLERIRELSGDIPVLFTLRSKQEGGEKRVNFHDYCEILSCAAGSGYVDAIDVEAFMNYEPVMGKALSEEKMKDDSENGLTEISEYVDINGIKSLVEHLQDENVKVIASNHDFDKTPSVNEIVSRLVAMQKTGADVVKIAVMPKASNDVLKLLNATEIMSKEYADTPIVTMSMGNLGMVTRMDGGIFGNSLTFASAGKASAPGQIAVEELRRVLNLQA